MGGSTERRIPRRREVSSPSNLKTRTAMGASASTVYSHGGSLGLRFVPVKDIMEQVHACLVPAERDFLLSCLDEMHRRCDSLVNGKKRAAEFHEEGAIEALLEMLGMFRLDEVFLRQAIKTLVPLCGQDDGILDHFVDLGGRDALDEALDMHKEDNFITEDGGNLGAIIRRYAKGVAKRDAARVSKACRYCVACRPLADLSEILGPNGINATAPFEQARFRRGFVSPHARKGNEGTGEDIYEEDPAIGDLARITRLLDHMDKYPNILDVLEPCVDALIAVGKSGMTAAILESKCVAKLLKAMQTFPKARSLQWKGLLAIIHLAKRDEVCFDLGRAGAVQLLVVMWPRWDDDEMRQLILWAMNELARIETNQLRMSTERVGCLLRETMEPTPARLAAPGAMMTAEHAERYCVPIKLKRLYRGRKLGSPFAKEEEASARSGHKAPLGLPQAKALFGRAGDDWHKGESGQL